MTKSEGRNRRPHDLELFDILASDFFRHLSFVICHSTTYANRVHGPNARTSMIAVESTARPATRSPQPAEDVVVVRGLTKTFKDFWGRSTARAVDNVEFAVRRGEVFGLLGP